MLKDSATPWDGLPALSACCCCSLSAFDEDTKACAPAGSLYEALADCVRSRESRVRRGGPLLLLERARTSSRRKAACRQALAATDSEAALPLPAAYAHLCRHHVISSLPGDLCTGS